MVINSTSQNCKNAQGLHGGKKGFPTSGLALLVFFLGMPSYNIGCHLSFQNYSPHIQAYVRIHSS